MKTRLTRAELDEAERRLMAQLGSATAQRDDLEASALQPTGDPDGQQSDEGMEDSTFDRDRDVLRVEDELVYEVSEALGRIAAGTYGICESCERPIEKERLELVPQARLCAACAQRAETAAQ